MHKSRCRTKEQSEGFLELILIFTNAPVKVARLNDVHVRHDELATVTTPKPNHRKILEQLAANCARAHDEERGTGKLGLTTQKKSDSAFMHISVRELRNKVRAQEGRQVVVVATVVSGEGGRQLWVVRGGSGVTPVVAVVLVEGR